MKNYDGYNQFMDFFIERYTVQFAADPYDLLDIADHVRYNRSTLESQSLYKMKYQSPPSAWLSF